MSSAAIKKTVQQHSARDDSAAGRWQRALAMTAHVDDQPSRIFPLVVEELARFGDAPALIGAGEIFSHAELVAQLRRYGRWALAQQIGRGDVVALIMGNRPDYLAIWLGITRIGGVVALINNNLEGEALSHCLKLSGAKLVIVAEERADELERSIIGADVWRHDRMFEKLVAGFSAAPLPDPQVTIDDPALLIYTSGTTGLPKAAHVSHRKVMLWTHWFAGILDAGPDDRLYACLPMYHSWGGVAAPGAVLLGGGAVICREKFSASAFWGDVAASGTTIFAYIGELCRYLLASDSPAPTNSLRLACGNGLSGAVWTPFQRRFAIPHILEFYAATEGNFSLYNMEEKPGAVGRVPEALAPLIPITLVKFDEASGQPVRSRHGFCIPAANGEAGEAICKITESAVRFEGYTDKAANGRKILRDVFARGDAWFRSGDLMRKDAQGFYHFVDRLGDTFRWKGENVATAEVESVLGSAPHVTAAAVYGVRVPGAEGRAGMAALQVGEGFDPAVFREHVAARLPGYARPIFIRLAATLEITGTFKPRKRELADTGFDPATTADPLFADLGEGYVTLDAALYVRISSGRIRL